MKERVMVYEVKRSASSNFDELFNGDRNYFYWNDAQFKELQIGDYVIVVNTNGSIVLFTQLDAIDIPVNVRENETEFTDLGSKYTVPGQWGKFIRLKVIKEIATDKSWKWKSFGSSEKAYFNGDRVDVENQNRKINIASLKEISDDELFNRILDESLANFTGSIPKATDKIINTVIRNYDMQNSNSMLTAIKTKPFLLLAGISGTGKSRSVRTLAFKTCSKSELQKDPKKPGNYELIPVKPNWHDSSELIGYVSRINGAKYVTTAFLKFIIKAWKNIDIPFFLCLDEMNLAPVEQYFAEYLSILETRQVQDGKIVSDNLIAKVNFEEERLYEQLLNDLGVAGDNRFIDGISIPENLVVIGTVNMDETTHSFSRKVLDRAMTFEMNEIDLNLGLGIDEDEWKYPSTFIESQNAISEHTTGREVVGLYNESKQVLEYLNTLNSILDGTPFKIAYRVRDEFLIYCYYASQLSGKPNSWLNIALDELTAMKILCRIEGDENRTERVLSDIGKQLGQDLTKSSLKIKEMQDRLHKSGYTSFWS